MLEQRTLLSASHYVVNLVGDAGTGSGLSGDIRYCITQADQAANASSTITFDTAKTGSTITLTHGELVISDKMTITGPGASSLMISGNNASRLFDVASGGSLTLQKLTLSGGLAKGTGASAEGGAIYSSGTLALSGVTVKSNEALGSNVAWTQPGGAGGFGASAYGGGIYVAAGSVTLTDDTLSSNNAVGGNGGNAYRTSSGSFRGYGGNGNAGSGGGLYVAQGTATLTNDTLSSNKAAGGNGGPGGGLYNSDSGYGGGAGYSGGGYGSGGPGSGGGLYAAAGTVTLNDNTLSGNNAAGGSAESAFGGGIDVVYSSNVLLHNTLVAANLAGGNPADIQGSLNTASSYNLVGDGSGGLSTANHNLLGSSASPLNPLLASLANNGGPTQTMALLAGSPAFNYGDIANAPAYDQRGPGFPRVVNGTIDIGAFEGVGSSSTQASSLAVTGFPSVITAGYGGSFTVKVLNADGTIDTSYAGTVQFSSSDPLAVMPASYTFTAADKGVHTFSATLKTAGSQSLTATDTTNSSIVGKETGITVNPAAAASLVFYVPGGPTAGSAFNVTVTAKDAYGNIATGYRGTVHFTSSDAKAVLPANYTFTSGDAGQHTFSITLKTEGDESLTATDTVTGSLTMTRTGILVQPAAASKFLLSAPSSVRRGAKFSVTLTVEDAYGNVVYDYLGTVHFSSSNSTARLPANYTFTAADAGVHTFTSAFILRTRGNKTITATDTQNSALTATDSINVA
jgi:hypothetical protein